MDIKDLMKYFKPQRQPAESGHALALTGAVVIATEDGHTVVLTPKLARDLAPFLVPLAIQAEGVVSNAT